MVVPAEKSSTDLRLSFTSCGVSFPGFPSASDVDPASLATFFSIAMASSSGRDRRVVAADADEDDLANVEFETSEEVDVIPTFDSMGLREDLLRGIYAYGESRSREQHGCRISAFCRLLGWDLKSRFGRLEWTHDCNCAVFCLV